MPNSNIHCEPCEFSEVEEMGPNNIADLEGKLVCARLLESVFPKEELDENSLQITRKLSRVGADNRRAAAGRACARAIKSGKCELYRFKLINDEYKLVPKEE